MRPIAIRTLTNLSLLTGAHVSREGSRSIKIAEHMITLPCLILVLLLGAGSEASGAGNDCPKLFGFRFPGKRDAAEPPKATVSPPPPTITKAPPPKTKYKELNELNSLYSGDLATAIKKLLRYGGQETEEDILLLAAHESDFAPLRDRLINLPLAEARAEAHQIRHKISQRMLEAAKDEPRKSPAGVRAARKLEREIVPNFPNRLRATDEEVIALREAYPLIGKNIDEGARKLRYLKLDDPSVSSLLKERNIARKRALLKRFRKELDPRVKRAIEKIWQRLNDSEAFAVYVRSLAEDAAVAMQKAGGERKLDALARGELVRNAVMETLVSRHRANGNAEFSTITRPTARGKASTKTRKTGSNNDFRAAVGQGPFFDKPFGAIRHGIDTHFLQVDYVADVIWEATEGQPRLFWDFLGSKKGIEFWVPLFDSFREAPTFARPEYLAHQVSELLKITD